MRGADLLLCPATGSLAPPYSSSKVMGSLSGMVPPWNEMHPLLKASWGATGALRNRLIDGTDGQSGAAKECRRLHVEAAHVGLNHSTGTTCDLCLKLDM